MKSVLRLKPRIYSFSTYKENKTRTVGLSCLITDENQILDSWRGCQALTLNKLFGYNENQYLAAAKGKVSFSSISREKCIRNNCFQVKNDSAQEVFCGNSSAASAAIISRFLHKNQIDFKYDCDDFTLSIFAEAQLQQSLINVHQTWIVKADSVSFEELNIANRKAVKINLFNDYTFIMGPLSNIESVIGEYVTDIGLKKKLAVIYPSNLVPQVHFYNCNGLHGAAPQTGLASLSMLMHKVDWITKTFSGNVLSTPNSVEILPEIVDMNSLLYVKMPDVDVRLVKIF